MAKEFNYFEKGAPKLDEEFKRKFIVNIKGKDAVKVEGLTAVAHEKGMWKFETDLIQFPSDANGWTAICQTTIGGYDYDPITKEIVKVIYKDIGDANVNNCGKMVAASYIRMASTRSQARALRKYTNIDMLCSAELSDGAIDSTEPIVDVQMLTRIKTLIQHNSIGQEEFGKILFRLFGHTNYQNLTVTQASLLIETLENYASSASKDASI